MPLRIDASDVARKGKVVLNTVKKLRPWMAESLNVGLTKGQTDGQARITARYNVGSAPIEIHPANAGSLKGEIQGSGGMKPVSEFGPSGGGWRQTVSVEIRRGNRKPITSSSRGPGVSGAFLLPDGRVMERRSADQYPISPVYTIGIPQMLRSHAVADPVRMLMLTTSNNEFKKRFKFV